MSREICTVPSLYRPSTDGLIIRFSLLLEGHHFISPLHQLFSSVLSCFRSLFSHSRLTSDIWKERSITGMQRLATLISRHKFERWAVREQRHKNVIFVRACNCSVLRVLFDHAAATLCSRCSPDLSPPVCVQRLRHAAVG